MAKKKTTKKAAKASEAEVAGTPEAEEETGSSAPEPGSAAEIIKVMLVGEERAVLAGKSILRGESRRVTRAQFDLANENHPDAFEEVGKE